MTVPLGIDDPPGHALDAGGVSEAGTAVLLNDEGHVRRV
jgi:hypothetical protein